MELKKQRRLLVRNTLADLEMAVIEKLSQGYEFDPDNEAGGLREALETCIMKRMPITIGMFIMGEPPKG